MPVGHTSFCHHGEDRNESRESILSPQHLANASLAKNLGKAAPRPRFHVLSKKKVCFSSIMRVILAQRPAAGDINEATVIVLVYNQG
jgi:hypothetical protein